MFLCYEDFIFDCEARGLTKQTLKSYRSNTLRFLNYFKEEYGTENIRDIRQIHIKKYFKQKKDEGLKNSYINTIHKVLKSFFTYCLNEKYIILNPVEELTWARDEKTAIEVPTDEEVIKLLNVYNFSHYMEARNKLILAIGFDTGIRASELIDILDEDVQKDRILIHGKGLKERFIPISRQLKRMMRRYEKTKKLYFMKKDLDHTNYFLSRTGLPLTPEALQRVYKIAQDKSSIRKSLRCSPHTARHYYATKLLSDGKVDIFTISKLLGHSNINITQRYLSTLTSEEVINKGMTASPLSSIL